MEGESGRMGEWVKGRISEGRRETGM